MLDEYDAGMGTTPGAWEVLSDMLAEEDASLPNAVNEAIYALRDGRAKIVLKPSPTTRWSLRSTFSGKAALGAERLQDGCGYTARSGRH